MSQDLLGVLDRAVDYALSALDTVTPELLQRPTPCSEWNLRMLLAHVSESIAALQEGIDCRRVSLFPTGTGDVLVDPARDLRRRLTRLRHHRLAAGDEGPIAVADQRLTPSLLWTAAGLEITVHAWDVFRATGRDRAIPRDLAAELLAGTSGWLSACDRHALFAAPLRAPDTAGPGDELLALVGRANEPSALCHPIGWRSEDRS